MPKPLKMNEQKELWKEVREVIDFDVPKNLHPESNPDHALKLGQLAGVNGIYAQNGAIFTVRFPNHTKRDIHIKDIALEVFTLILKQAEEKAEEEAANPKKAKPEPKKATIKEDVKAKEKVKAKPGKKVEPSKGEIKPADGEMDNKAEEE